MLTNSIFERDARIRRYSDYLAADGHFVDVICLASESGEDQSRHPHVRVFPLPYTRRRREGFGLMLDWLGIAANMFLSLTRLEIRQPYDVVHVHNMPDFLVFCALAPRLRGCPVLLNVHDPVPELTRSKMDFSQRHPLVRAQCFIEAISAGFSTHVITATPYFKKILESRGVPASKITVIINASDQRFFRPDSEPGPVREKAMFTLLYVGTVAVRYGLEVCVRALKRIRERIPGIRFKIIPKIREEGVGLENCLRVAREIGVADLIEVGAPAPLEEMPGMMKRADVGIYPALPDCHMNVALSLKIPEMAAVGLPILASRLAVLEDLFGDDAIAFVPPGDPEAFADKVVELWERPELMERLAANARVKAAALSWEHQYPLYTELLESILGRKLTAPSGTSS